MGERNEEEHEISLPLSTVCNIRVVAGAGWLNY
jgi:hypothetical protein